MTIKTFSAPKIIGVIVAVFINISSGFSQDLEPRSLSSAPIGGNFAIASYGNSRGNILIDPSLPVEDLDARIHSIVVAYARSLAIGNKQAKIDVVAPYLFAEYTANLNGVDTLTRRSGIGDPLVRLSVLLVGDKALKPATFFKTPRQKFSFGLSTRVRLPLGDYDRNKLINLGANRWGLKLGAAASYKFKRFIFEAQISTWFFTTNHQYFNNQTISQEPLLGVQGHVAYVFKPGIWAAASIGTSGLGETAINGVYRDDKQQNSRYGFVFAYRIHKAHALKAVFTSGITTRYGANFDSVALAYQFMWFDK